MEENYEVFLGDKPAGKLQLLKEGLYYKLVCYCQAPKEEVYRLYALVDGQRKNLGVVIPEADGCTLMRKIPVKQLQKCTCFFLSSRSDTDIGKFVPIYPEEPFSYIVHLETAFLDVQNGQIGAYWKKTPGAE